LIASVETALYQQAETFLHRVDPRLKLFSCLFLVALSFSASAWIELIPVLVTVAAAAWSARPFSRRILQILWLLRWLLLFTLLLHLFFSSGKTLWGVSWLSLDGLLLGAFVGLQVSMAVAASTLLGITTSTLDLSLAFGWFVRPLGVMGFRTVEWQKIILQALDFIPLVHAEIGVSSRGKDKGDDDSNVETRKSRFQAWGKGLHCLILRLVNRGDEIACRLAEEGEPTSGQKRLPAFLPMVLLDQLFVLAVCLVTFVFWLVG
jgi:energy-coupling factor transport system permease protein